MRSWIESRRSCCPMCRGRKEHWGHWLLNEKCATEVREVGSKQEHKVAREKSHERHAKKYSVDDGRGAGRRHGKQGTVVQAARNPQCGAALLGGICSHARPAGRREHERIDGKGA